MTCQTISFSLYPFAVHLYQSTGYLSRGTRESAAHYVRRGSESIMALKGKWRVRMIGTNSSHTAVISSEYVRRRDPMQHTYIYPAWSPLNWRLPTRIVSSSSMSLQVVWTKNKLIIIPTFPDTQLFGPSVAWLYVYTFSSAFRVFAAIIAAATKMKRTSLI